MTCSTAEFQKQILTQMEENPKDCFYELLKDYFGMWIERHEFPPKTLDKSDFEDFEEFCQENVREGIGLAAYAAWEEVSENPEDETQDIDETDDHEDFED